MTISTMTVKERWLAALQLRPVDRLPFWPKLDAAYLRAQAAPFNTMTLPALHDWVGSDAHVGVPSGLVETRTRTGYREMDDGVGALRRVYETPHGTLTAEEHFDVASQAWYPVEHPVKTEDDLDAMTAWYADTRVTVDAAVVAEARATADRLGGSALVVAVIGTSPLMTFLEFLAGAEQAHLLLMDAPERVEALFDAMQRVMLQRVSLAAEQSCADALYLMENTSTTLLSPAQYRAYCLPHITAYGEILRAAGRLSIVHMCGHLRALLPDLATLPVTAFEAFTSPTVGNTTLQDGRAACPDICLIGGTNATVWMRPTAEILAQLARDLDVLPHHRGLVLTSAGVMPPCCAPATVRAVGEWVKGYPVRA